MWKWLVMMSVMGGFMGHPDRRAKRLKKKQMRKEEGLDKNNIHGRKDLTPYNAVNKIISKDTNMIYK